MTIDDYHRELLDALRPINGPLEMAQWASRDLARRLHATGKSVLSLTLRDINDALWQQETENTTPQGTER